MANETRPFAVITGASRGIGFHLANEFAKHGYDLLITSDSGKIEDAGEEFEASNVQVQTVQADLRTYEGVERLWEAVKATGRQVDVVALNAGVGVGGDFARQTELQAELDLIALNVTSTVHLAKLALRDMVTRGDGALLFTSSIAAGMPAPFEAVYGASKAFVLSFARSLRNELKDTQIKITALQPGPTDTDFFHRAGMDDTKVGAEEKYSNDPAEVAKQGYEALMDNKDHVFASSMKTKIQGEVGKFAPESVKAELHRKQAEPGSAKG